MLDIFQKMGSVDRISDVTREKIKGIREFLTERETRREEAEYRESPFSLVHDRIWVGSYAARLSHFSLRRLRFRVLNLGLCERCFTDQHAPCPFEKDTLHPAYRYHDPVHSLEQGHRAVGLVVVDEDTFPINEYFEVATNYIHETLRRSLLSHVMVISKRGLSRAAVIVAAYLMIKRGFRLARALEALSQSRRIAPNTGFLVQLIRLENRLFRSPLVPDVKYLGQRNPIKLRKYPKTEVSCQKRESRRRQCCLFHSYHSEPTTDFYDTFTVLDDEELDWKLGASISIFDRQTYVPDHSRYLAARRDLQVEEPAGEGLENGFDFPIKIWKYAAK